MAGDRPAGLTLGRGAGGDVAAVVRLVESAYRGSASRQGWTSEADLLAGQRTDEAAVRGLVEEPGSLILLARLAGELVGCCHLADRGELAYFGMFAVAPPAQGEGIGSALLGEAERVARAEWGATRLQMTVLAQRHDLVEFYRRRGYLPTGETRPFPYGDERFGLPLRLDLEFAVLEKPLPGRGTSPAQRCGG